MKNFKSLLPFLLMLFVWAGCDTDDLRNDVDELKNRVESLEAQVSAINDNMNVLKVLTDGKQTIQSCVYDEASNSYKLVLSDNTELTLTQGKQGTVNYPQITISQNGTWVINGEDSGKEAVGDNAPTPKFAIDANGYWTVDFGNGATQVLGADGQPVLATTSGSVTVTDEFFKDVDVVNGELVVTLQNDEVYSLPIVEALVCDIQTENVAEFKNGVLTVGYGEEVSLNVEVKGDNAFVSAPAGWTAVLGEPDAQNNIAVLTLKAPAESAASTTLGRAATADNTKDLTVQVNKGVAWAVDKIQVEATKVISSYYDLFVAGEAINIEGIELKKSDWESVDNFTIKQITSAGNGSDENKITQNGIYFIQPGATAVYAFTGAVTNMYIIRDASNDKTATLKMNEYARLNNNSDAVNSTFFCGGIIFDTSEASNYQFTANGNFGHIIFKNCSITFMPAKSFVYISQERTFQSFVFENCKLNFKGKTEKQMFNIQKTKVGSISLINNIFYAEGDDVITQLFNFGNSYDAPAFTMKNNTFYNVVPSTTGFVNCKALTSIDIQNNLFYSSGYANNQILVRFVGDTDSSAPISGEGIVKNNFANKGAKIWKVFYGNNVFDGSTQIDSKIETMFSNIDFDNAIFTPVKELESCGAKFE